MARKKQKDQLERFYYRERLKQSRLPPRKRVRFPDYRKFDGKVYYLVDVYTTKKEAQKVANEFRNHYFHRIIPTYSKIAHAKRYLLYFRRKPKALRLRRARQLKRMSRR